MAFKLAELAVEIGTDQKPLDAGLSQAKGKLTAFASASKGMAASMGSGIMIGLGSAMTQIAGQIAGKVTTALFDGIHGAANLNESIQKTQVVFGGAAKSVFGFSEAMQAAFGSSRQEILDASSSFGLIAKGAGLSKNAAAGMAVSMAKLADDASSFYNVPLDVALHKIQSGLVGQSRPLREFGVILTEDAVKLEALRMGLGGTSGALTSSAKVMARASLIAKGLADATGDHLRTQGEFKNQTRELSGRLENLGVTIGGSVIPPLSALTNALNNFIRIQTEATEGAMKWGEALRVAMGGKVKGKLIPFDGWADTFGGPKASEAARERATVEADRSDRAKALAGKELEKPAEDAALAKARTDAYKAKKLADTDARRERFSETTPGRLPLSMAIRGKTKEDAEAITRAYHAEADAEAAGLDKYKSIIKEKIGLTLGFHEAIKKGAGDTLGALAGRFLTGKDVKESRGAAETALALREADARDERKRNFVTQTFTSAQEQNRAIETMTSTFSKKAALPADELREIKKNSDAQVNHLKTCAESLKALVGSSIPAVFAP
jgi:hypothetical protein